MRTERREDANHLVAEERKWLWWQYVGMGIFLATWPATMAIGMWSLPIRPDIFVIVMVLGSAIIFGIGQDRRDKLKEGRG